jgi:hypothetical protein
MVEHGVRSGFNHKSVVSRWCSIGDQWSIGFNIELWSVVCDKLGRRLRAEETAGGAEELAVEAQPCLSAKSTTEDQI